MPLTMTRIEVPAAIEKKMKAWRGGWGEFPQEYIQWQKEQAETVGLPAIKKAGYTIHSQQLVNDGWGDGMRFLQVVIEDKRGNLAKLKWSDQQTWFKHNANGGGWTLFVPGDKL